ncbi:MAG: Gfo/Idh/MocA family oxidoreductase [Phycisphaerae bacterium]|nr:Gfo/Idh/MocA family oxidoreductase [Phycisphaerae bacterium]
MANQKITAKGNSLSRRQFLASGAGGVAAFMIVPRHVLGGPGNTPPSEKLNIATIGAGGMGSANTNACRNENIVGLCDVDDRRAKETYERFPNARRWKDFRQMLEKQKEIEAVIIAAPDHVHAPAAMAAMKRGKHVYVQKPLTRTVYEARMLTEAARKYKVKTQMGNQGRSGEGVRLICEWIWDGAIGDVREVHAWTNRPIWPQGLDRPKDTPPVPAELDWDLWLAGSPLRPYHPCYLPFSWRGWWDFGGGALADMACHVCDPVFAALKLKYPTSVQAEATEVNDETFPKASTVTYEFPAREGMPAVKLVWYDGGRKPERPAMLEEGRSLEQASSNVLFVGDKGLLRCGETGDSPRLIPEALMKEYKRPAKTLPRVEGGHEQNWVDACKGKLEAACSHFDYSGPLTEMVVMGNLSLRREIVGAKLLWDGRNMKVTNNDVANEYVNLPARKGFGLDEV